MNVSPHSLSSPPHRQARRHMSHYLFVVPRTLSLPALATQIILSYWYQILTVLGKLIAKHRSVLVGGKSHRLIVNHSERHVDSSPTGRVGGHVELSARRSAAAAAAADSIMVGLWFRY